MAAWASQPPQAAKKTPPKNAPAKTTTASKSAPSKSSASNKSSASKSYSASRSSTATKKAPSKATSASLRKSSRKTAAPVHTAASRPRQLQPTPERYHEIQDALVAKGYLSPEQATGNWDQNSIDALKRFQAEQKLDASGKITSMSLIALGLGPKHDSDPLPTPAPGGGQDRN